MENRGQLPDKKENAFRDISYYAHTRGVNIYCKNDRISFVFTRITKYSASKDLTNFEKLSNQKNHNLPDSTKTEVSRMEMQFVNANPDMHILSAEKQPYYEKYYLAYCPEGITSNAFKQLTYKNLWPDIDLVLRSSQSNGLEYSFIVNPGGNINNIQIQWNGADTMNMLENNLGIRYSNGLGHIQESGLKSYLEGSKQNISCKYIISERENIGFHVDEYNGKRALVIDPTLIWGDLFWWE